MSPYKKLTLNINGADRMFVCDPESDTLAAVLRRLGLTGTKVGCGSGVCGACTVLMDGTAIHSCTRRISSVKEGAKILTIEGIGTPEQPHPLQTAFVKNGAVLCGFCTPGFVVSASALLAENPAPSREDVRDWFRVHRNLCRCTGYKPIVDAVLDAASVLREYTADRDSRLFSADFSRQWKNGQRREQSDRRSGQSPRCLRGNDSMLRGNDRGQIVEPENDKGRTVRGTVPAALAKACGAYAFGNDVALGMPKETLHVALVQPKIVPHARIVKINHEDAEWAEGVYKIILLEKEELLFYGDVCALVCADTRAHARAAACQVTVVLEALPEIPSAAPAREILSVEGGNAQAYAEENGEITVFCTEGVGTDQLADFARIACQGCGGRPIALSPSYNEYLALAGIPQNNPLAAGIPTITEGLVIPA